MEIIYIANLMCSITKLTNSLIRVMSKTEKLTHVASLVSVHNLRPRTGLIDPVSVIYGTVSVCRHLNPTWVWNLTSTAVHWWWTTLNPFTHSLLYGNEIKLIASTSSCQNNCLPCDKYTAIEEIVIKSVTLEDIHYS